MVATVVVLSSLQADAAYFYYNAADGYTYFDTPLYVTGNVQWTGSLLAGSVPWARLTSFPAGCPAGQFVTAVGGTLSCATPAGGIGGSGTLNYIPRWTGTTTLGNSLLYDTGTNVGIGTTAPSYKLDVAGNVRGTIFYDWDNTAFYVDPNSLSLLNGLAVNGQRVQGVGTPLVADDAATKGYVDSRGVCIGGLCAHLEPEFLLGTKIKNPVDSAASYETSVSAVTPNLIYVGYRVGGGGTGTNKVAKTTDGGNTWTITTVTTGAWTYLSLDAADANTVYVAFVDSICCPNRRRLHVSKSTDGGSTWTATVVDGDAAGGQVSLDAVDANTVYVSYYNDVTPTLKVAKTTNGGSAWTIQSLEASSGVHNSLEALDANTIYISYLAGNDDLKVIKTTNGGSTWTVTNGGNPVDSGGSVGSWNSIDVVDANAVYVSYYDSTNQDLKVAKTTNGGTSWTTQTVDQSATDIGAHTSIYAIDANNVFVSYKDVTNADLKVAITADGGTHWLLKAADIVGSVGDYSSIYAADANTIYIAYRNTDLALNVIKNRLVAFFDSIT